MNVLDLIILCPIAIGLAFGLYRGLVKELTSLLAILLGIYGAKILAPSISKFFVSVFGFSMQVALPVSYLVLFVAIVVGLHFLAKIIDKVFDFMMLGGLNKVLGGLFGVLKMALIVSVLINVFDAIDRKFPMLEARTKQNSVLYKPILRLAPNLWQAGKNEWVENKK